MSRQMSEARMLEQPANSQTFQWRFITGLLLLLQLLLLDQYNFLV